MAGEETERYLIAAPIPGWPEYLATRDGHIVGRQRMVRGKVGMRAHAARRLKPFPVGKSLEYLGVVLCRNGKKSRQRVHRLVAATFLGQCPDGHDVDHKDFNTKNNNASNLQYVPSGVNRGARRNAR